MITVKKVLIVTRLNLSSVGLLKKLCFTELLFNRYLFKLKNIKSQLTFRLTGQILGFYGIAKFNTS